MGKRVNSAKWMENQGRWQIAVQRDGERKVFYSSKPGRAGQREANAKADAWLDDGILPTSTKINKLFQLHLEDQQARTSKSSWRKVEQYGRLYILPIIGRKTVDQVNDQDLQRIINKAFDNGLSKKSLTNIRATITGFFKFCRKMKVSTYRPEFIDIPKSARKAEKQILQPEDLVKLFTADETMYKGKIERDPYINAYRFQVLTGLRPGELLALEWGDINGDTVSLHRSINIFHEVTAGKNDNARRVFTLPPIAREVLQDQPRDGKTVFGILTESHYRDRWKIFCRHNGIPYVPPYNLRHTFVSMVSQLSEADVKKLVGHSQNMDTFGVYGHEISGEKYRIASQLQEVFDNLIQLPIDRQKKSVL